MLQFFENLVRNLDEDKPKSVHHATTVLPLIKTSFGKYSDVTNTLKDHEEFEYADLDPKNEKIEELYITTASKLKFIENNFDAMSKCNNSEISNKTFHSSKSSSIIKQTSKIEHDEQILASLPDTEPLVSFSQREAGGCSKVEQNISSIIELRIESGDLSTDTFNLSDEDRFKEHQLSPNAITLYEKFDNVSPISIKIKSLENKNLLI